MIHFKAKSADPKTYSPPSFLCHNTDFSGESACFYPSPKVLWDFRVKTDKGNPISLLLQGSPQ